jgi:hypothetical protein
LSDPDAERRDAARGAGASHLVDQRRGQAGAVATKRLMFSSMLETTTSHVAPKHNNIADCHEQARERG